MAGPWEQYQSGPWTQYKAPQDPAYNAAADTPAYERPMVNIGAGLQDLVDFAKQLGGSGPSDDEIKAKRARDAQLAAQDPVLGKAYQMLGQSLPFLAVPAAAPEAATAALARVVGPTAARVLSTMGIGGAVGAASGAAQPVTSQESRGMNTAVGAAAGAAVPGAFAAAGPAVDAVRKLLTTGGAADKAGFKLADLLKPGDLEALQSFIQSKQQIPATAAEITQNPALAVAERQANLRDPAGAAEFVRDQQAARQSVIDDALSGAGKLDAAKFGRDAATEPMRSAALNDASKTPYFFAPVLETAQSMLSGSRGADPAVKKLANYVAGELELAPRAVTTGNETPSIFKTIDKAIIEEPQAPISKTLETVASEQPQHGYGSNVPAPYSPIPDTQGPISNVTPEKLYTVRKVLLDKLNGPAQLGDDLSAAAKGRRRDVMQLVGSIDSSLDDATQGAWGKYLSEYANRSGEVNSAQAKKLIQEALDKQASAGNPVTANRLSRVINEFGTNDFGPTLDKDAASQLNDVLQNLRQSEGIQKLVKGAGTSGGGSNTAMDLASDMAQNKITSAIPIVSSLLKRSDNLTQAAMADALRNPQLFINAVSKAQKSGQPLSPTQDAILRILRAAGSSTPALLAPQ